MFEASPQDFFELESAENMTEVHLRWLTGASIEEVLLVLERWRHLRRLTLHNLHKWLGKWVPRFEDVCDFVMKVKHLVYWKIICPYISCNGHQLENLRDKVNQFFLPQRPNFKFDISTTW